MMFFTPQGVFCPEQVADWRTREVLIHATADSGAILGTGELLASAIRSADARVMEILSQSLLPGHSLDELQSRAVAMGLGGSNGSEPRDRRGFSPTALETLDEFAAAAQAGGSDLSDLALELLLYCLLRRLDPTERDAWRPLDVQTAVGHLRRHIAEAMLTASEDSADRASAGPSGAEAFDENSPFALPLTLVSTEDLTYRALMAAAPDGFPFDGEPQFEQLFDALSRGLHRQQVRHILLSGERGVGQHTVLAEFARRAATGRIPFLRHSRFLLVDCCHVPPEESRRALMEILTHAAEHDRLVVCLDGFANLLRADQGRSNQAILLAALARVRCRVIGLIPPHRCEEFVSENPEVLDFFLRVPLYEPDLTMSRRLTSHFAAGLAHKYRVQIDSEAVDQAVLLSANYLLSDRLPAKAVRILHRACEDVDFERSQLGIEHSRITTDHVVGVVSEISGVPRETLFGIAEGTDYHRSLKELVVGQEHAVNEVATELSLIKAGLTDPKKPSVMLFVGQTGTGKTEMAKALARLYSSTKRLRTYTLGNFVESHSVSGLIGVPPGYVGHDQGGPLINDLNADPYCVCLLDEADKAHPDVLQPFLNLFDEGWTRDQRGVLAYADKAIFILTTNVGQHMIADMAAKGKSMEEITARMKEALAQIRHSKANRPVFSPEFLARIKRIIVFKPLDLEAMKGIGRKLVAELRRRWHEQRGRTLEVATDIIEYLADQAHQRNEASHGKEGGRVVQKLLADIVDKNLQLAIAKNPDGYRSCDHVSVQCATPSIPGQPPEISVQFGKTILPPPVLPTHAPPQATVAQNVC